MAGIKLDKIPHVPALALWIAFTVLFALGCLTTTLDLLRLPAHEEARASGARQHILIDPVSGEVMMSAAPGEGKPTETFDVGTKEEAPKKPETMPEATPHPAPEAPPTEPPATPEAPPAAQTTPEHAAPPATEPQPAANTLPTLRTAPTTVPVETPTRTSESLVSAPAREVTETIGGVQLPKRGEKDITPASLYARPFKQQPEQVLISFLITDVGLDPQSIGGVLSLPGAVSVAYSPYTRKDMAYSESVRAAGHEVWLMLPVMTDRYPSDDPGPLGLIAQMPEEEMLRRAREILGHIPGAIGFALASNEAIGAQKGTLDPILKEVSARGLFMVSGNPTRTLDQLTSDKELTPLLHRADLVLDPEPSETQIKSRLAGLPDAAKEKGQYLVIVSSRPQSLQILGEWLKQNPLKEPFALAPVSALYKAKTAEQAPAEEAKPEEGDGHGGGHGGGEKKKEEKKKPKEKPKKPLPQDQYLKPAGEKEGGGHGGGGH